MEPYKCQLGVMRRCEIYKTGGCDGTYNGGDCECAADNHAYMPSTERDELKAYRAIGTVEELTRGAALREAQDEGRVVVLDTSRKPLVWGDDDHNSCLCPDCCEDLMGIPYGEFKILQCPACGQYLDATKIITRAEAEAAQREEGEK